MRSLFFLLILSFPPLLWGQSPSWRYLEATNAPQARHENAMVALGGNIYLIGGRGLKPIDIYDPATRTWTQGAPPPLEMHHFQAIAYEGLIFVMGAFTGSYPYESPIGHIYIYDPLKDQWQVGPEIPAHRQRGAAGAVVHNDKFYLVCGIVNGHSSHWVPWLDEYDPATHQWRELPDAPNARDHFQAAVVDNRLYALGGRRSGYESQTFRVTRAEVDLYDFASGSWQTLPERSHIPTERAGCASLVMGKDIWVIGGESGSQQTAHAEVEAFDTRTHQWKQLPSLQRGRHGTQAFLANGAVYIGAGCGNRGGSPELNSLEVYAASVPEDLGMAPLQPGKLEADAEQVHVRGVAPYTQGSASLRLHNAGGQALLLTHAVLTGSAAFSMEAPGTRLLLPGQAMEIPIRYTPQTAEPQTSQLLLKSQATSEPLSIHLQGHPDP